MQNFSFILNFDKEQFKFGTYLIPIPGIDLITTQRHGKLFVKKYFVHNDKKKIQPRMIQFTSKDRNFNTLYSIDVCNRRLETVYGAEVKPNISRDILIAMVSSFGLVNKFGSFKDSIAKLKSFVVSNESKSRKLNKFVVEDTDEFELQAQRLMKLYQLALFLTAIAGVYVLFRLWFTRYINWKEEMQAYQAEQEVNKELFKSQEKQEPAFQLYHKLISSIQNVIDSKFKSLVIYGPPGMSKTYIVKRTLFFNDLKPGIDFFIQKGSTSTLQDVYKMLFDARRDILILDDFDTPLRNPDMVNFLKSITDSYFRTVVSLPQSRTMSSEGDEEFDYPKRFEFRGKIIIITNLKKEQIDKALLSRCPALEVSFNSQEVVKALELLIKFMNPEMPLKDKLIVFNYIKKRILKQPNIHVDFRTFKTALDAYSGDNKNWMLTTDIILGIGKE
jgi:hypothetical protein